MTGILSSGEGGQGAGCQGQALMGSAGASYAPARKVRPILALPPPSGLIPPGWDRKTQRRPRFSSVRSQMRGFQHLVCRNPHSRVGRPPTLSLCLRCLSLNEIQRSPRTSGEICGNSLTAESKTSRFNLDPSSNTDSPGFETGCFQNKAGWPWEVGIEPQTSHISAYFQPCFPSSRP